MLTYSDKANYSLSGRSRGDFITNAFPLSRDFVPLETDIVCGRGNVYSNRPGNKAFSEICRDNLLDYVEAPKRSDKSRVVASVLSQVLATRARFVKMDRTTKRWYQMSKEQAHDKTGHAMRDMIRICAIENDENASMMTKTLTMSRTKQNTSSMGIKSEHVVAKTRCRRDTRISTLFANFEIAFSNSGIFTDSTYNFDSSMNILQNVLDQVQGESLDTTSDEDDDSSCYIQRDFDDIPFQPCVEAVPFREDADYRYRRAMPSLDLSYPLSAETFFEDNTEPQPSSPSSLEHEGIVV